MSDETGEKSSNQNALSYSVECSRDDVSAGAAEDGDDGGGESEEINRIVDNENEAEDSR